MKKVPLVLILLALLLSNISLIPADLPGTAAATTRESDPWSQVESILSRVKAPAFPDRDFQIGDFGAVGDGKTDCTEAFRQAISACHTAGGGRVVVPPGDYATGAIHLKSNVDFHLSKGARVLFSTDPEAYLPMVFSRWDGIELMNYSPLLYAFGQENIAVTGEGLLDGQASAANWWSWKGKANFGWKPDMPQQEDPENFPALKKTAEDDIPVAQRQMAGHYLRPCFLQFYRCKNVLVEGVTFLRSPRWILNPVLCQNVTIQRVTVESLGPNSDGCDPESCREVLIKDCVFNTGDDCIAIKSGRDADGRRIGVPSENIVIQNCRMAEGHGGIVIGSEVSGGVRNVFAENCRMDSPHLLRALRIKTSSRRGGIIENVFLRNIEVGRVREEAIIVNMFYEEPGSFMPVVRNIQIRKHDRRKRWQGRHQTGGLPGVARAER